MKNLDNKKKVLLNILKNSVRLLEKESKAKKISTADFFSISKGNFHLLQNYQKKNLGKEFDSNFYQIFSLKNFSEKKNDSKDKKDTQEKETKSNKDNDPPKNQKDSKEQKESKGTEPNKSKDTDNKSNTSSDQKSEKDKDKDKSKKDKDDTLLDIFEKFQDSKKEKNKANEEANKKFYNKYIKLFKPFVSENTFNAIMENINLLIAALILLVSALVSQKQTIEEISLIDFIRLVEKDDIEEIQIFSNLELSSLSKAVARCKSTKQPVSVVISDKLAFINYISVVQHKIGKSPKDFLPIQDRVDIGDKTLTNTLLIVSGAIFLLFLFNVKNHGKKPGSFLKSDSFSDTKGGFDIFGKANPKLTDYSTKENIVDIKFDQIAGMESAKREIVEFVDFLKNPDKYTQLGAKIPRGALLVGPPGTGKTLLAKATAGEAKVPFFAMSGSEFVEMFVGVGASRVRQLFQKAKKQSPSIVFIDEIDAIGKSRSGMFQNDEKDSTLNQLLVEMDGFGTESNVVVLAATNFNESLDPALTRPGRFDRKIEILLPDIKERMDIFKIYLKKVVLNGEKTLDEYAKRLASLTPGFSGADISNLVNEAAIISARENKTTVDTESFEKASERVIAGMDTKRPLDADVKNTIAIHESGHAVVSWLLENASPLVKISIIPRSKGALGFNQFVSDDRSLHSKEYLLDEICTLLGGRLAEKEMKGVITTGASDDLNRITDLAYVMVTKLGMSDLGLQSFKDENYVKPFSSDYEYVSH